MDGMKVEGWDNGRGGEGNPERGYRGNGGLAGGDTNLGLRAKGVAPLTVVGESCFFFSWI